MGIFFHTDWDGRVDRIQKKLIKYQFSKQELHDLLYNYNEELNGIPKNRPKCVKIWDETLRDGEQTPGIHLSMEEKAKIAVLLDELGTSRIAAGFPAVTEAELENVKYINKLSLKNATILGIARPRISDIDACIKADLQEIVIFMPTSALMLKILHETPEGALEKIGNTFDYAKKHGLRFNWVAEDGTRSQPQHLFNTFQLAIDRKAESIVLSDTVGVLQPETTALLVEKIKKDLNWRDHHTNLGIHTHNDFGQAVANTLVAVYHGATYPHVCVNGYGERAGNAAFEEVIVNLEHMGVKTGIQLNRLAELSQTVEEIFALPLSAHKPIVGENAFSHESGLHINAIISHPISYEPINPTTVGQHRTFYLGKFSGSGAIVNAMETKLKMSELEIPPEVIKQILTEVKFFHESASKKDIQNLFNQTKQLMRSIRSGVTDTEFFQIVQKYAAKYLKGTWADAHNSDQKKSD